MKYNPVNHLTIREGTKEVIQQYEATPVATASGQQASPLENVRQASVCRQQHQPESGTPVVIFMLTAFSVISCVSAFTAWDQTRSYKAEAQRLSATLSRVETELSVAEKEADAMRERLQYFQDGVIYGRTAP